MRRALEPSLFDEDEPAGSEVSQAALRGMAKASKLLRAGSTARLPHLDPDHLGLKPSSRCWVTTAFQGGDETLDLVRVLVRDELGDRSGRMYVKRESLRRAVRGMEVE